MQHVSVRNLRHPLLIGFVFSAMLVISPARAEMVTHGFVLEASTMGLGADYVMGFGDHLQVRAGGNLFNYSYDVDGESTTGATAMNYSGDLKLRSAGATLDWYPTGSGFRLSAGLFLNQNEITNDATCNNAAVCELGNDTFAAAALGTVSTKISFAPLAPYFGLGFGNPLKEQGFSLLLDIGVLLQGSADVDMKSSGTCNSSSTCMEELKNEEKEIEDEIKNFKFYPVVNLGLGYRF